MDNLEQRTLKNNLSDFEINLQLSDKFDKLPPEKWICEVVKRALLGSNAPIGSSVSIVITTDDVITELNAVHRGLNETTDVLAFSFVHEGEYYGDPKNISEPRIDPSFKLPPGVNEPLGEIIISYQQAERQSREFNQSLNTELAKLITHGTLHLMGYDHLKPDEKITMEALEKEILK